MPQNQNRRRLILIVFSLSCISVAISSVLLVGYFLHPTSGNVGLNNDPLGRIESDLAAGRSSSAWEGLSSLSKRDGFNLGIRGLTLVWKTWQREPREILIREVVAAAHEKARSDDERALAVYLLLETKQSEWAIRLDKPGFWKHSRPDLEAELSLHREPPLAYRFASFDTPRYRDDSRIQLDRAYAFGFLGDYSAARQSAANVINATDAPGSNGSTGMIEPARGLCRRQAARMIQIMSVWDASDTEGEKLMREALLELMVDPPGLLTVAPHYFDILVDSAAYTGEKQPLNTLYMVAEKNSHTLSLEHRENRSLLSSNPVLRPETYTDLRRLLASNEARDPRFRPIFVYEAAGKHNDDRAWRLTSWFLWNTGDLGGMDSLMNRKTIAKGAWSEFWEAVRSESQGNLLEAADGFKSSRSGTLETVSVLNQARIALRQGKVETAAILAATARQNIAVRSLGLYQKQGNGYASLYADAIALEVRILRAQGREADAEGFLRELRKIDENHPELYHALGVQEVPDTRQETHE